MDTAVLGDILTLDILGVRFSREMESEPVTVALVESVTVTLHSIWSPGAANVGLNVILGPEPIEDPVVELVHMYAMLGASPSISDAVAVHESKESLFAVLGEMVGPERTGSVFVMLTEAESLIEPPLLSDTIIVQVMVSNGLVMVASRVMLFVVPISVPVKLLVQE